MQVSLLTIRNFRGIQSADLYFPQHVVLVGDNNTGKSTIFEALNLALGPERLARRPAIDEHDFYLGRYTGTEGGDAPEIQIEVIVTSLSDEQCNRFQSYIEWWDSTTQQLHQTDDPTTVDQEHISPAVRVCFVGHYDEEEDDFIGETYFSRSREEENQPRTFSRKDKQYCGFLYLRSLRTGTRALSLERGSLLDIILRIKEIRPQIWERTIGEISEIDVASDPELGIDGILRSIEEGIQRYVPREWGVSPHLKVSTLTREHLRNVITAFVGTGGGQHAAPFYRQGTGTINLLVLSMLSQIAQDRYNVIFAMEEPETAIPPYAQKRIVHEIRALAAQSLFSSHSPYVLEEFALSETAILSKPQPGKLVCATVQLPASVKHKRYRQQFRTRFCEALLARRVLLCEGKSEAEALPVVARRLAELDDSTYTPLEALGICSIDAGGETQIAELGGLYRGIGKTVFAVCDRQSDDAQKKIEGATDTFFMHPEDGVEDLVIKNTTEAAITRFLDTITLPPHLANKYPAPKNKAEIVVYEYLKTYKGEGALSDFLTQCNLDEIPEWFKETCVVLRKIVQPSDHDGNCAHTSGAGTDQGLS
ncbi:MAG: AAA family ATPase [Halofilum sp. (in: g-proteobacteria)]|nr:AAA family ATPase [Halofilum sp. (in: g-proteobacteria)]